MNLQKNLFGGITAAIIALPLALAFGVASGLGPTAGIYGAIILGFFASLFGGTATQISGPTGPMTVIMASAVITLEHDIGFIVSTILLAGLFQIAFGIFKIGKFVQFIPYPVISGFMSGIGIIIIILQINPYLGLENNSSIIGVLSSLPSNMLNINLDAFIIATLTLIIMFLTPTKIVKFIPAPLIALLLITPLSVYLNFNVSTIGTIPVTLPSMVLPSFTIDNYSVIITLAFTLAVLGTIDTLLTSIVADSITQTKHKPNQELIGQGIGNSLCALVGAIPGAGATMRTVINIKSGGTHKISGIIHSVFLLIVVLFLAPLASQIPLPLLAGILIKVGIDILDYKFLQIWKSSPKHDLIVMICVLFITVFIDLITAVAAGFILASLLIVYRITKETRIVIEDTNSTLLKSYPQFLEKSTRIIRIKGAFFFGSNMIFEENVDLILDIKTVVIDISDVPFLDITAMFTLMDYIVKLQSHKIDINIIASKKDKLQLLSIDQNASFKNVVFHEKIVLDKKDI